MLPISWAGFALLLLGVGLLVIDAHVVTHGALTVAGLISLVVGSLLLFHNAPSPYNHVNTPLLDSVRGRARPDLGVRADEGGTGAP